MNLKSISLCANVPPPLPTFTNKPLAFVVVVHFCGDNVKALLPTSFKTPSSSRELNSGLVNFSQIRKFYNYLNIR